MVPKVIFGRYFQRAAHMTLSLQEVRQTLEVDHTHFFDIDNSSILLVHLLHIDLLLKAKNHH